MKQEWDEAKELLSDTKIPLTDKINTISRNYPFLAEYLKKDSSYNIKSAENDLSRYDTLTNASWYGFYLINNELTTQQVLCFFEEYIGKEPDIFLFYSYPSNAVLSLNNEFLKYKDDKVIPIITRYQKNVSEDCVHPEWTELNYSYYNHDNLKDKSSLYRVTKFYYHHPKYVFINAYVKLFSLIRTNSFINLYFIIFIIAFIIRLIKKKTLSRIRILAAYLIMIPFMLTPFIFHLSYLASLILFMMFLVFVVISIIKKEEGLQPGVPVIILLILLNFLLLSFFVGTPRYILPIDFIIKLISVYYLILFFKGATEDLSGHEISKAEYLKNLLRKESVKKNLKALKSDISVLISNKRNRYLICAFFFILYFIVFYFQVARKWDDKTYFGYNTAEYHSMGVNLAKGHGLQRYGAMENYSVYKFDTNNVFFVPKPIFKMFNSYPGMIDVWRTPGYGLFLGIIYKIGGIHPLNVKFIQFLLLIFIASFLPALGYKILKTKGFISGVLAGFTFILIKNDMAGALEAETVVAFLIFIQIFYTLLF